MVKRSQNTDRQPAPHGGTVSDPSEQRAAREFDLFDCAVFVAELRGLCADKPGQRLARTSVTVAQLDAVTEDASAPVNEVHKLKDRINALP